MEGFDTSSTFYIFFCKKYYNTPTYSVSVRMNFNPPQGSGLPLGSSYHHAPMSTSKSRSRYVLIFSFDVFILHFVCSMIFKEYDVLYRSSEYYVEVLSSFPRKVKDAIELYFRTNQKIEHQMTGHLDGEYKVAWVHMTLMDMKKHSDLFLWMYHKSLVDTSQGLLVQIPIPFYNKQVPTTCADLIAVMKTSDDDLNIIIVSYRGSISLVTNMHEPNISYCHDINDLKPNEECLKITRKDRSSFIISTSKSRYFLLDFSYQVTCKEVKKSGGFMNVFGWFKAPKDDPFLNMKLTTYDDVDILLGLTANNVSGQILNHDGSSSSLFDVDILKTLDFGSLNVLEALVIDFDTSQREDKLLIHILVGLVIENDEREVEVHIFTFYLDPPSKSLEYFGQNRISYPFNSSHEDMFNALYDMKLAIPGTNTDAFIYCHQTLWMTKLDTNQNVPLEVFSVPNEKKILSHGVHHGHVNFISPSVGIVEVKSSGKGVNYIYDHQTVEKPTSMQIEDKDGEEYMTLEKSFEIYREQSFIQNFDITSDINELVQSLIRNKIDSNTLKVKQKYKLFNDLYKFLNEAGVWDKVNEYTKIEFYMNREKIESCHRIFELKLDIFTKPLEMGTSRRYVPNKIQEFFVHVSTIDDILSHPSVQNLDTVKSNTIFLELLGGALIYRSTYRNQFDVLKKSKFDLWTWKSKVRDLVIQQIRTSIKQVKLGDLTSFEMANMYSQLYSLVDFILQDMEDQLSLKDFPELWKTYKQLREEFIHPFTEIREYHIHAKELAEKHHDHKSLIKVLEERVIMDKMKADEEFRIAAFEHYYATGRKHVFISLATLPYLQQEILTFLKRDHEMLFLVKAKIGQLDEAIQELKKAIETEQNKEKAETLKAIMEIAKSS